MRNQVVLLAGDDESILLSLGHYLERSNFHVQTAKSGEAALSLFRTAFFDLVITDLVMAGINGIKVLQEVKKSETTQVLNMEPGDDCSWKSI